MKRKIYHLLSVLFISMIFNSCFYAKTTSEDSASNDTLSLIDGRNYKFTDLNANVYTFKYEGASAINYDLLVDLLVNDMFDHVTALADLTLNMTSGENIHLMVNYLTDPDYEKTFVYVGGSTIAVLTLIANAKNGVYADVAANNLSQVILLGY